MGDGQPPPGTDGLGRTYGGKRPGLMVAATTGCAHEPAAGTDRNPFTIHPAAIPPGAELSTRRAIARRRSHRSLLMGHWRARAGLNNYEYRNRGATSPYVTDSVNSVIDRSRFAIGGFPMHLRTL